MSRRTTRGALASAREDAAKTCVCLCTFLVLGINFWSHIASLGACRSSPQRPPEAALLTLRRRGGCGLVACCCRWTRPASVYLHQCPGAQQLRQQPGGHPSPPSSHWQVAACTRSLRGGLGAFGRAATVAAVPGPWCEPCPGTSGPLVMWAPARCRASGGRGGRVTWAHTAACGDLGLRLLGLLASLDSPSRRIPCPRRLQALPAVLLGRALLLRNLGPTFLSDSCFATRVSRCCLCAEWGTGCVRCGSWTWPCLQILKRLGAERPGRVVHRQWAHQGSSMGRHPGQSRAPGSRVLSAHPRGQRRAQMAGAWPVWGGTGEPGS